MSARGLSHLSGMMIGMREIADPFVVARPAGARVRTRLRLSEHDAGVLWQVGRHLGGLAGRDLARRCADGRRSDRAARKRALTAASSSRWAGAITRTSDDQWARARANQVDQARNLRAAIATIEARLAAPVAGVQMVDGRRVRGYRTRGERWHKSGRRDVLAVRLARLDAGLAAGRVSVVRGGRKLAKQRHHLDEAQMTREEWRGRWDASRLSVCADGEADCVRRRGSRQAGRRRDHPLGPRRADLAGPAADPAGTPVQHARPRAHIPAVVPGAVLLPWRRGRRPDHHRCGALRRHLRPRPAPLVPRRVLEV